jgi:HPt (histidine-containing phosphotransfer) domain-containing protein
VRSRLAGHARLRPAVRKFAERLGGQIAAFDAACQARDYETLAQLAHWLKGAGGTVGYDDFTEVAKELELAAQAGADADVDAWMTQIRDLASRVEVPEEPAAVA